ncbi:hypothetical protein J6590_040233 [Homalodisca vitripennis]|nr:hypothetical protein J6590_040233 [Homalodisca vitripennis]
MSSVIINGKLFSELHLVMLLVSFIFLPRICLLHASSGELPQTLHNPSSRDRVRQDDIITLGSNISTNLLNKANNDSFLTLGNYCDSLRIAQQSSLALVQTISGVLRFSPTSHNGPYVTAQPTSDKPLTPSCVQYQRIHLNGFL